MTSAPPAARPALPTIATIAHEVGVSTATVSKVLNGRYDVAAETRALVEASLERHRYRRRNKRRPSGAGQIDLVFHELDSAWAMEIISGVEAALAARRIGLTLSHLDGAHRPGQQWLDGVLARRPLGVLLVLAGLTPDQQQQLHRQQIPHVVIDTDSAMSAPAPTVGSDNHSGGLSATRHLIELGHRRIAIISGPPDVLCSQARVAGYRSAHEEAGLPVDPDLMRSGAFGVDAGFQHATGLLQATAGRPSAIFAGSDMQAIGVLRAARQLGLAVPADLSVIGYDNLPLAAWTSPALTTVHQPLREMAGSAARMLLDLARGAGPPTSQIDLVTELVVRESTARPAPSR